MTLSKRIMKKVAVGVASLALIAPLGMNTVNDTNPTTANASAFTRTLHHLRRTHGYRWTRRHTRRGRRWARKHLNRRARQGYRVNMAYKEACALERAVNSPRLHISKHHRRHLQRRANHAFRRALALKVYYQEINGVR